MINKTKYSMDKDNLKGKIICLIHSLQQKSKQKIEEEKTPPTCPVLPNKARDGASFSSAAREILEALTTEDFIPAAVSVLAGEKWAGK